MRLTRLSALAFAVLVAFVVPAAADDTGSGAPKTTGVQNAISRINEATARHIQILTDLLAKVPQQAQSGIQRAIEAAQQGHDKAIAALQNHATGTEEQESMEAEADTETDADTDGTDRNGKPATTGLARALQAVTAGFDKSVSALQKVIGAAPDQAKAALQAALANVQLNRSTALQNLAQLLAGQRPDHVSTDRPARADRPDRPDRPYRPERPERPEVPQRPEVPDHPAPPSHG